MFVSRNQIDSAIGRGREHEVDYDFALSFAGAQRAEARDLASILAGRGCRVFFDEYETTSIVGSYLTEYLYEIYAKNLFIWPPGSLLQKADRALSAIETHVRQPIVSSEHSSPWH